MYFPFLRGRQFELIALRELLEEEVLSSKIIPIIEPVKLTSTLIKTIDVYNEYGRSLAFITNPIVGSFLKDLKDGKNQKLRDDFFEIMCTSENMIYFWALANNSNPEEFIDRYGENIGTICTNRDGVPIYEKYFLKTDVKYNLIPDESGFRRRIRNNRVLLADRFNKQERNYDYINCPDESFSDDHLYYLEDGYIGFSDYSVIGDDYNDTGFAPYAVAIHIVYFDSDSSLRIRHFVSDSHDDISDPAGKFQEALSKLVDWNKEKQLNTIAIKEFEDLYRRETYPGLGTVKKLSVMHHLELIGRYLDTETSDV